VLPCGYDEHGHQSSRRQIGRQAAATIMKSNADAEKFAVQTLLGAGASSLANVGAGVGGNLDISA
jgi:hypothetical protein